MSSKLKTFILTFARATARNPGTKGKQSRLVKDLYKGLCKKKVLLYARADLQPATEQVFIVRTKYCKNPRRANKTCNRFPFSCWALWNCQNFTIDCAYYALSSCVAPSKVTCDHFTSETLVRGLGVHLSHIDACNVTSLMATHRNVNSELQGPCVCNPCCLADFKFNHEPSKHWHDVALANWMQNCKELEPPRGPCQMERPKFKSFLLFPHGYLARKLTTHQNLVRMVRQLWYGKTGGKAAKHTRTELFDSASAVIMRRCTCWCNLRLPPIPLLVEILADFKKYSWIEIMIDDRCVKVLKCLLVLVVSQCCQFRVSYQQRWASSDKHSMFFLKRQNAAHLSTMFKFKKLL